MRGAVVRLAAALLLLLLLPPPRVAEGFLTMLAKGGGKKAKFSGSRQSELLKTFQEIQGKKKLEKDMGALEQDMQKREEQRPSQAKVAPNADWRTAGQSSPPASMDEMMKDSDVKLQDPSSYRSFDALLERTAELSFKDQDTYSSNPAPPTLSPSVKYYRVGDFTPLDEWQRLVGMDDKPVDLSTLVDGAKPIIVIADPRSGSSEINTLLDELRTKLPPKLADIIVLTPDTPAYNRKLAKKSRIPWVPILSDAERRWMNAHLVTVQQPWGMVVYFLDPKFLKIVDVMLKVPTLAVVEQIKARLQRQPPSST
jgi:hypothetical protein